MATFVLVHGAFAGGWCWHWVAPELRATGHEVYTPTLTGLYDPGDEDTRRQDARIRDEPDWRERTLRASHAAPFGDPRALAGVLLAIAEDAA